MGASLAEELSSALDGVELPSGDGAASGATDAGEPSGAIADSGATDGAPQSGTEDASGRDEKGRFVPKAQPAAEAAPAAQPAAPQPGTEQPGTQQDAPDARSMVTPPATWSAAAKAIYGQLPEVARREIAKREQDYARGIQQHAEKAKLADTLLDEMRPYEAIIRAENGTPQSVVRNLLNTAYRLRSGTPQDRGQLLMRLAQEFNADITPFIGSPAQQQGQEGQQDLSSVEQMVRQLVAPVFNEINTLKTERLTAQQRQTQQMESEIQGQIEAFRDATGEDGSPKHLYFENVKGLMSAYFANGQATSLEQAYEMACWANPEVRAALIADQQRADEAKRLEEARRKAQDAGRAGFNVQGQGGVGIAGSTSTSLRDEISSQLEAAYGGGRV